MAVVVGKEREESDRLRGKKVMCYLDPETKNLNESAITKQPTHLDEPN